MALEVLIDVGVDRILTSGTEWGSGNPAIEGIDQLTHTNKQAGGRIEVVVAGGISIQTLPGIAQAPPDGLVSFHAYSGALVDGQTTLHKHW